MRTLNSSRTRRWLGAAGAATILAGLPLMSAAGAAAPNQAGDGDTYAVSIGDSYISGEGGRWVNNAEGGWLAQVDDRDLNLTDRVRIENKDVESIYNGTWASGCHRSDVAEINGAVTKVGDAAPEADQAVNLACSGATSDDILRGNPSSKGHPQPNQIQDFEAMLKEGKKVKVVVLSVGGNDLGLSEVVTKCGSQWGYHLNSTCRDDSDTRRKVESGLAEVQSKVSSVLNEIKRLVDQYKPMGADGQAKIIVQSYPQPLPSANAVRDLSWGWTRLKRYGCPFWQIDMDYLRDIGSKLDDKVKAAALETGVNFLSLQSTFEGHEVCNKSAKLTSSGSTPAEQDSEWMRYVVTKPPLEKQESLHPNATGQKALQACLAKFLAKTRENTDRHEADCVGSAGMAPQDISLNVK